MQYHKSETLLIINDKEKTDVPNCWDIYSEAKE